MLDHLAIAVSDLARSRAFYERVLASLGYSLRKEVPQFGVGFGVADGPLKTRDPHGDFWIYEGSPFADRFHLAFSALDRASVEAFHAAGLAAGGTDNGPPGPRPHYHENYYAAFILDPDGYNIEAVCHDPL